ncbi:hypothetical protein L873DRAFT_1801384 [Choiromyces venosus 120613-1]|uniref:Uncharacterized protein n=1 Tax=Choiromyces venosus 120613-1 TaxID=1336337 RepID=A0A3N4K370_9PEZI|nr:hypothetical protein L873DRAFT_1801384 [Choiromyces venosus 120613-1]
MIPIPLPLPLQELHLLLNPAFPCALSCSLSQCFPPVGFRSVLVVDRSLLVLNV